MKRLGRVLECLIAVVLTVMTFQSGAAEIQQSGRDFNHMTTGFMLQGGHAVAACETCHIGGIFKGTPRTCDGCHALGKRVVATPKSSAHIVTDAPCETCHFNTSTFYGARFNHANAVRGNCQTCHNGRLSNSKPVTHSTGNKATRPCDDCHRSVAWLPATWNHDASAAGRCSSCHISSPEVSPANRKPSGHSATIAKNTYECDACHNYLGWYPARYKHNSGAACVTCHDGITATGKTSSHTTTSKATFACDACHTSAGWLPASFKHTSGAACSSCHDGVTAVGKGSGHIATTSECNQCHTGTTTWTGALGGKPAKHIPDNSYACSSCHTGSTVKTGSALHVPYLVGIACYTCHGKNTAYSGQGQTIDSWPSYHESSKANPSPALDCSWGGCHKPAGSKGSSYTKWD